LSCALSNPDRMRALVIMSTWAWPTPPAEFHTRIFPWRTMHAPLVGPYLLGNHSALAGRGVYLSVVDREGNIVSLIQSNYSLFGSGITVRGMGFALQNRGALFSLDPASPNVLAPRKRPFHTIIPAFMERGDQHIGFGIMGGANQPLAHAQFVSNVVDYGMNLQQALETARFTVRSRNACELVIESRVPAQVREQLSAMGNQFRVNREYSSAMGRGQAVLHDTSSKVNYGGSDARADGSAEPEPPPVFEGMKSK
jgi:gamma-glutamyltranspeptidase/glutathione hydrolase